MKARSLSSLVRPGGEKFEIKASTHTHRRSGAHLFFSSSPVFLFDHGVRQARGAGVAVLAGMTSFVDAQQPGSTLTCSPLLHNNCRSEQRRNSPQPSNTNSPRCKVTATQMLRKEGILDRCRCNPNPTSLLVNAAVLLLAIKS